MCGQGINLPLHSGGMEKMMSNFMTKMLNFVGFDTEEEYEDNYYAQEQSEPEAEYDGAPAFDRFASRRSSRVVKLHDNSPSALKVVVLQPESFEEARDITNHLKERKPIIVNMEALEKEVARRIVDFLSGSVYALDGDMKKISNGIFLVAPENVDIMGEELRTTRGISWGN